MKRKMIDLNDSLLNHLKNKELKTCFLSVLIFSLLANAFAYFNFAPHHDAINHSLFFAGNWEISLGRFLQPIWAMIRGHVTMPWLTGVVSIIFLSISAWFCIEILNIKSNIGIILTSGFLSINYSIMELCGTYGYVLGSYTFALMLVFAGIWIVLKYQNKYAIPLAALLFFISFGIYQVYITVILVIILILIMLDTISLKNEEFFMRKYIKLFCALILSVVIYFIVFKLVIVYTGIEIRDTHNSIKHLSALSLKSLLKSIIKNYKSFVKLYFLNEQPSNWLIGVMNIIIFMITMMFVFARINKTKKKIMNILLFVLCVLSFPIAAMLISILAENGKFIDTYATFMFYPGCIALIENSKNVVDESVLSNKKNVIPKVFSAICIIILLYFVRFSNQVHSVSKILYDRTMSNITIIMSSLNNDEEYIPGETEVVLIGSFGSNDNITKINKPKGIKKVRGYKNIAITYSKTFANFVNLMGYPMNVNLDSEVTSFYQNKDEVKKMPVYPMKGFYKMIDGKMIIKLSE